MDFCQECGGMLVSEKNDGESQMKCRSCGEVHEEVEGDYKVTEEKEEDPMDRLNVSSEEDQENTLPEMQKECPNCSDNPEDEKTHGWWMEQTRASDEPPTRYYKCIECGNVHKEYD